MMNKIALQTTRERSLKRLRQVIVLLPLLTTSLSADPYDSLNDPRMNWYKAAKFGLMIHWGIYAEPAGQWSEENGSYESWREAIKNNTLQNFPGYAEQIQKNAQIPREEYKKIANDFDWSKFNAQDIIDLCYATGQRYIVITAKHHDGFAMYHSKADPFNIVEATPVGRKTGRDPLRELAEACHATKTKGPWEIKMCFYYSHCIDWMEDGGNTHGYKHASGVDPAKFQEYFERKMFPQVKELMTEYGEVGLIWFDVPRVPFSDAQAEKIVHMMREAQPATLVNGRLGKPQFVDYLVSGDNGAAGVPTDYYWETPASINHTYGYGVADQDWKSWEELAEIMVKVIAHNGNYLLNIGPKSDGSVPKESVEILHQLGKWVKLNSEAIFGTECTPYRSESMTTHEWGTCTQRDGTLYLFVQNWPENGRIDLPLIKNQPKSVSYLAVADKAQLKHGRSTDSRGNTVITIEVPQTAPDADGIIVLKAEFEGKVELDPIRHAYDRGETADRPRGTGFPCHHRPQDRYPLQSRDGRDPRIPGRGCAGLGVRCARVRRLRTHHPGFGTPKSFEEQEEHHPHRPETGPRVHRPDHQSEVRGGRLAELPAPYDRHGCTREREKRTRNHTSSKATRLEHVDQTHRPHKERPK